MAIKDFIDKWKARNLRVKELEEEDRAQTKVLTKKKNSNERELERFMEEERQETIKQQLDEFRRKRQEELWHGPTILSQKNIFKDKHNMLNAPNIFKSQKMPREKGMFFK